MATVSVTCSGCGMPIWLEHAVDFGLELDPASDTLVHIVTVDRRALHLHQRHGCEAGR